MGTKGKDSCLVVNLTNHTIAHLVQSGTRKDTLLNNVFIVTFVTRLSQALVIWQDIILYILRKDLISVMNEIRALPTLAL